MSDALPHDQNVPTQAQPLIDPVCKERMGEEVARARMDHGPIISQGAFDVYICSAKAIPNILREIGRLRELSFRAVGEGTGRPLDLDVFDEHYLHIFVWHREQQEVVGAYRLGRTDLILSEFGSQGLYTSTLYEFATPFLDFLNPALELGRSFVAPAWQKSIHPLALLWRGMATFASRQPRYARLFGPVSISDDYSALSRDIIVTYMRRERSNARYSGWVSPRNPYFPSSGEEISRNLRSIEEVSAAVANVEPDGKGLPVLLRQYVKLNATLLEFNVDPDFGSVLDALVLVDLREAPAHALTRHMGRDGYRAFAMAHGLDVSSLSPVT
jgi:hypothetical protein